MENIVWEVVAVEADAQSAETHAEVAEAAATATVVAAETAVMLASAQAATVVAEAAETIRENEQAVRTNEEEIAWLRSELEAHRLADSTWKMEMSNSLQTIRETVESLTLLTPPVSVAETVATETAVVVENPQSADVVDQPVAETVAEASPRQRKLKRL